MKSRTEAGEVGERDAAAAAAPAKVGGEETGRAGATEDQPVERHREFLPRPLGDRFGLGIVRGDDQLAALGR